MKIMIWKIYLKDKSYIYLETILVNFSIFTNLMYLFIFKIIIKLIMTSSRFDPSLTLKVLNLSLLRFNKRSGFQNSAKQSYHTTKLGQSSYVHKCINHKNQWIHSKSCLKDIYAHTHTFIWRIFSFCLSAKIEKKNTDFHKVSLIRKIPIFRTHKLHFFNDSS